MIPAVDDKQKNYIDAVKELIKNEVNVKELRFVEGSGVLVKKVKCNFRTMGKKYGKLMKGIAAAMDALSQDEISMLQNSGQINVLVDGQDVVVESADVEIISEDIPGWLVSNEGNLTVALEVELNDELRNEGMARELINRIQNIRKENGYEITDRINVEFTPDPNVEAAVNSYADYIKTQVLADNVSLVANEGVLAEIDGLNVNIKVTKS